jgi:hypothetical protein
MKNQKQSTWLGPRGSLLVLDVPSLVVDQLVTDAEDQGLQDVACCNIVISVNMPKATRDSLGSLGYNHHGYPWLSWL